MFHKILQFAFSLRESAKCFAHLKASISAENLNLSSQFISLRPTRGLNLVSVVSDDHQDQASLSALETPPWQLGARKRGNRADRPYQMATVETRIRSEKSSDGTQKDVKLEREPTKTRSPSVAKVKTEEEFNSTEREKGREGVAIGQKRAGRVDWAKTLTIFCRFLHA